MPPIEIMPKPRRVWITFSELLFVLFIAAALFVAVRALSRPDPRPFYVLVGEGCGPEHVTMVAFEEDEFNDDGYPVQCDSIDVHEVQGKPRRTTDLPTTLD